MLRCFLEHKIKTQCHLARKGMMMTKHHGPSVHVPLSKGNLVQRLWVSIYPTRNLNTLAQWTIFSAENQKLRSLGYLLCQEASCRTNGNTEFQERSDSSLNPLVKNSLETLAQLKPSHILTLCESQNLLIGREDISPRSGPREQNQDLEAEKIREEILGEPFDNQNWPKSVLCEEDKLSAPAVMEAEAGGLETILLSKVWVETRRVWNDLQDHLTTVPPIPFISHPKFGAVEHSEGRFRVR